MKPWVLVLGCSTGHGGETCRKLAKKGYGIIGFHFDRGEIKVQAEKLLNELKDLNNGRVHFFNKNAADVKVMDDGCLVQVTKCSDCANVPVIKDICATLK